MGPPPQDWSDFSFFVQEYIPRQTIPILRKFANTIEIRTRVSVGIRAGDKKADIVEKVVSAFRVLKNKNDLTNYASIRQVCEADGTPQHRYTNYTNVPPPPAPTFGGVPNRPSATNGHSGYGNGAYGGPSAYRAQPAAGPSRNGWQTQPNTPTAYSSRSPTLQDWKPNPMWKPIRALTNMEALPDIAPSESSHTRRERKLHVTLPNDIIDKLNHTKSHPQASPQHSIRIFCTSSDNYRAPNTPFTPSNSLITNKTIPIEYPNNPDVYVDDYALQFKERGLRGKPGSAPPFDLDKGSRGFPRVAGRMTSVTMGHTGPTTGKKKDVSKKFYFQIVYCEITTATELQNRIDRMAPAGPQESLNLLRKRQSGGDDDDDIEYGQSRLSLKDPLAYTRLTRPIRSTKCTHLQCFEPKWWISTNEKHPQWLCPMCNREIRFDELIVDGYTLDILGKVPDSYDDVIVEGDNQWHTEDNKYGSPEWMAKLGANGNGDANDVPDEKPRTTPPTTGTERKESEFRLSSSPDPKGKRKAIEILSSDDEDEQPLSKATSRPPPPVRTESLLSAAPSISRPTSTRPPSAAPAAAVIDLTLSDSDDSDDDDENGQLGFDRPNDRRAQGAGTLSVPPPKPYLQEPSSVRSQLAPLPHSPLLPVQRPSGFSSYALGVGNERTASSSSLGSMHRDSPALAPSTWADPTLPYDNFDNNRYNTSYSHDRGLSVGGSSDPRLHASGSAAAARPTYSSGPPMYSQAQERRTDTWRPGADRYRDRDSEDRTPSNSNWRNDAPAVSRVAPMVPPAERTATPTAAQDLATLLEEQEGPAQPPSQTSTLDDLFADEPAPAPRSGRPAGPSLDDLFDDDRASGSGSRPSGPSISRPATAVKKTAPNAARPPAEDRQREDALARLHAARRARMSAHQDEAVSTEEDPPPGRRRAPRLTNPAILRHRPRAAPASIPSAESEEEFDTSNRFPGPGPNTSSRRIKFKRPAAAVAADAEDNGGTSGASTPTTTASTTGTAPRKIKLTMRPRPSRERESPTDWDSELPPLSAKQARERRQAAAAARGEISGKRLPTRPISEDEDDEDDEDYDIPPPRRAQRGVDSSLSRLTGRRSVTKPNYNVDDDTDGEYDPSALLPAHSSRNARRSAASQTGDGAAMTSSRRANDDTDEENYPVARTRLRPTTVSKYTFSDDSESDHDPDLHDDNDEDDADEGKDEDEDEDEDWDETKVGSRAYRRRLRELEDQRARQRRRERRAANALMHSNDDDQLVDESI